MDMSNIKLTWMADELRAAGLAVLEHVGWKTRTNATANEYTPIAVLNHHTAASSIDGNYPDHPFWPPYRLEKSCNITIDPMGMVYVLNAGYAYDSGKGDPKVRDRIIEGKPPLAPADNDPDDRVNGNPYFIDIEVQHPGDGRPIVPEQYYALRTTNAVLLSHYGWDPMVNLLGHREWTVRKVDPRWNGFHNPMPAIRLDTQAEMESKMQMPPERRQDVIDLAAEGDILADINYYYPDGDGTWSADLPDWEWVNVILAASGNQARRIPADTDGLQRGDTVTLA